MSIRTRMNDLRNLARPVVAGAAATGLQGVANFFAVVYIARVLSPSAYGVFSFTSAVAAIVSLFTYMGIPPLFTRKLTQEDEVDKIGSYGFSLMGILSLVVAVGFLVFSNTIPTLRNHASTFDLWALIILANGITPRWFYSAVGRIQLVAIGDMLGSWARLILMLIFVRSRSDLNLAVLITVGSALAPVLLEALYARRFARYHLLVPRISMVFRILREALPLGITGYASVLFSGVDIWILDAHSGSAAVGYYSAAYRGVSFLSMFSMLYFNVTFPIISRLMSRDRQLAESFVRSAMIVVFAIAAPIGVGTIVVSRKLVLLVFGSSYAPSGAVLAVIIWSWVFGILRETFSNVLVGGHLEKVYSVLFAVSGVINVALMLVLVHWGPVGTASSLVISQAILMVSCGILVRRKLFAEPLGLRKNGMIYAKLLLSSAVMGLAVYVLQQVLPVCVVIIIGIIIYGGFVVLTNAISLKDIRRLVREAPMLERE